jgi:hypothetical protein
MLQPLTAHGLPPVRAADVMLNEHLLAAAAVALATWRWKDGRSNWLHAAQPPHHPFDFAC